MTSTMDKDIEKRRIWGVTKVLIKKIIPWTMT